MNKKIISGITALCMTAGLLSVAAGAAKLGDVNADNNIDIEDAVAVIGHVNGNMALTDKEEKLADIDGSKTIDIEDAVKIIAHINGTSALPDVEVSFEEEVPTGAEDDSKPDEDDTPYADQEKADYFAKVYYNALATYFTDQQEKGRNERDIMENDVKAGYSSEGIKAGGDYSADGDKVLADEKAFEDIAKYNGAVHILYDPYLEHFPFIVRWVSPKGVMGQYPVEIDHPYNTEKAEKLKTANKKAKDYFNFAAEYLADQETIGRKNQKVLDDGDFAKAVSPEGLLVTGESDGKGDKYLIEQAEYDSDYDGYVYIGFDKNDEYDCYDFFVQWKEKDGTIGQYPTPPEYEYLPMIEFGNFWAPSADDLSQKRVLTEDMVKEANGEAKSLYNTAMEYLADQETKGRDKETVFSEGDFAQANSEKGMKIKGEPTAAGDKFLCSSVYTKFDKYIEVCTVYIGRLPKAPEEPEYFIQFVTRDGAIGQYPDPISFEDNGDAVLGVYFSKE